MLKINFPKRKTPLLSTQDKAILATVFKTLNISSYDNILEVSGNGVLTNNNIFKNIGCYVTYTNNLQSLNGGVFEYILIYDLPCLDVINNLKYTKNHLDNGTIVVLNIHEKLSQKEINDISAEILNGSVFSDHNFTLIVG